MHLWKHVFSIICLMLTVAMIGIAGCGNQQDAPADGAEETGVIDRRSYDLGVIGAFAEVVGVGVKKLALSAPLTPEAADALIEEAERIAKRNNAEIYRETDFLVTDLFPAEITEGKHVLLIYTGATLQEYMDLKAKKQRLVESGQYTGEARTAIARGMGALLSYPEEKIDELLEAQSE